MRFAAAHLRHFSRCDQAASLSVPSAKARSASLSQATDILVRLTLVSGSELLCAISAQCAECSRYAAAFSLPDIQSPIRLSTHNLKLRHRDLVPHCTILAGR
jgi:hypothetical protein